MPEIINHCPLCGQDSNRVFDTRSFRGSLVHNRICNHCGFIFQSPRMDPAEYDEFYAAEYRKVYQGSESPYAKDLKIQKDRSIALLRFVVDKVPQLRRHLDIGCSAGFLLQSFENHYRTEPIGIEPGDAYRKFALEKGMVIYSNLDELAKAGETRFDFISMAHVLEHLSNPVDTLSSLRERFLSKDGWLLVEVPNLYCHDSFEIAHLSSFSSHTLIQTIKRAGFRLEKMESHGRPRSMMLNLYITILARPAESIEDIEPERFVEQKRKIGLLHRRIIQKVFPKQAWVQ